MFGKLRPVRKSDSYFSIHFSGNKKLGAPTLSKNNIFRLENSKSIEFTVQNFPQAKPSSRIHEELTS